MRSGGPILPTYSLKVQAGEQEARGIEESKRAVYGDGSQIDLILRPAVDWTGTVAIKVFQQTGTSLVALPVKPKKSTTGNFRLRGLVDDILPRTPGVHTLIFVIGAPDDLPKSVDAFQAGLLNGPDGWQVLRHEYRRR
jgi:hypothetical protein